MVKGRNIRAIALGSLALLASAAVTRTAHAQQGAATQSGTTLSRDDWQRAPEIFAAVGARPGSRIADLGAGHGWLTTRLAKQVGPTGTVFAADVNENVLRQLATRIAGDSTLRNVELILAEDDDPRLPFESLDGVVIVNAYHEMTKRVPVLNGILRALRPGGLLVIVDNIPDDSLTTRTRQVARHKLALDLARDDLEAHGFEIVSQVPKFTEYYMTDHWMRQWLLVARRSAK